MAPIDASTKSIHPIEIDKYMKGLVDTSFEEGHYEAGIALLHEMRSHKVQPAP
jgi:hypothetical protein